MGFKNTTNAYGSIAKFFHWFTTFLFLVSYCAIYYREWFAETDFESWLTIQLHLSIGVSLAGIVMLRIIWKLVNKKPDAPAMASWQYVSMQIGHFSLYIVMIVMPISGYLSLVDYLSCGSGKINYFFLYELTFIKAGEACGSTSTVLKIIEGPADLIHSFVGEWIVTTLLLIHIYAALYHHFIQKNNTLNKMTFYKKLN